MDREALRRERRREKEDLWQKLFDEEGTPEETARWLARMQELDPEHFGEFEDEYHDHLAVRRQAHKMLSQMHNPPIRSELADLVRKIVWYQASNDEDSEAGDYEYRACYFILERTNRDTDWASLIEDVQAGKTPEEVLEVGLAQKRRVFAMPGPVDVDWAKNQQIQPSER